MLGIGIGVPFVMRAGAAASALLTNLVAYWKLEEASGTRSDSHGTYHLTDNNSVGQAAGKLGQAASFVAASQQYLSRSSFPAMHNVDWEVVAWFYLTDVAARHHVIGVWPTWRVNIELTGGQSWVDSLVDGYRAAPNNNLIAANAWYFLRIWHEVSLKRVSWSLNNGTTYSFTYTDAALPTASTLLLGAHVADATPYNGRLDACGIWIGRTLSLAQRAWLYSSGNGEEYPWSASP